MDHDTHYGEESVSMGEWIFTLILTAIPFVNIIMMFVWAFSKETKVSKSNWAKAMLLFVGVGLVLSLLFGVLR
jgi:hypothetical protein